MSEGFLRHTLVSELPNPSINTNSCPNRLSDVRDVLRFCVKIPASVFGVRCLDYSVCSLWAQIACMTGRS